jgi:hypothetical protein
MLKRRTEARDVWSQGLKSDPKNETLLSTLKRLGVRLP